jgi:hypothetical protein
VRQAEAARQAELYWTALRQRRAAGEAGVTLSHQQCVALAGRAYRAWASGEPKRETTTAMVHVPVGPIEPGEAAKKWRWEPASDTVSDREPDAWAAAKSVVDGDPENKLGPGGSPLAHRAD